MGVSDAAPNAAAAVGVYTPRYRVDADTIADAEGGFEARGVETKAVPAADEDAVTMGVAAAEAALADGETARSTVDALHVATTTPPYEEFDVGATVAEILGLADGVRTTVHTSSTAAGTRALRAGFEADGPALVVAADAPRGEHGSRVDHAAGAGAAALLLSPDGSATLAEAATHTAEYPGTRFRRRGAETVDRYDATAYERRAFTEPVAAAVRKLDDPAETVAMTAPDGGMPHRAARRFGFDASVVEVASRVGDAGAASALLGLVAAWNGGAERVTCVGYGDGATVDALVLDGALPASFDRETEALDYGGYRRRRDALAVRGRGGAR